MKTRADIKGSKSNVAMNTWLPQVSYPCRLIGHTFMVCIHTENKNQGSFYPLDYLRFLFSISPLLGHLRYLLTNVPPQPNTPPDNFPTSFHKGKLKSSSTGSSFSADFAKPIPLAVVSLDSS
ncbi:hypothetical protein C2G38_2133072 [Gigaspora rosea]|uniref:Uncharacterized protein n=1 Tax=Gigaspora rosea TaxID=44941 RepID=A0A397U9U2_9GLOM|nr:hypothetical protein C2G38_2133072 [Gigaspora rosea]